MTNLLRDRLLAAPGLLALWDFSEPGGQPRRSLTAQAQLLHEGSGLVARGEGGPLSGHHVILGEPAWLHIPRADLGPLNRCGAHSATSVLAWLRRTRKPGNECEFVAGCWNETQARRQYGLFLNLYIHNSGQQVGAHVSHTGGPTPGHRWCMDAAIGQIPIAWGEWHCVGMTFDGQQAAAWLDGRLDERPDRIPLPYAGELFDGGTAGADFTVGAVNRQGCIGNFLHADLGGLAIFGRALTAAEMAGLAG